MQRRQKSQREHHLSPKSSLQPYTAGFTAGPDLSGHTCEHSDVDHVLMIDGSQIQFTKLEYQLFMLILEHEQDDYVSYTDIARIVYQRELNDDLLLLLRKRISYLRRKIADYGIDIVNVPYRGYKVSTFSSLSLPYRRGYRAKKTRTRSI